MKQRRKSSNFDMLCDPFKYQDYVNRFLDGIDEVEDHSVAPQRPTYRKRTRSNNYFASTLPQQQSQLPEIGEETYEQMKESVVRTYHHGPANDQEEDHLEEYKISTKAAFNI